MRKTFLSLAVLGMFAGCGGGAGPSTVPPSSPLHGGILVPLPENRGYVELLNEKRVKKGNSFLTSIVAYLLEEDQKTAFTQRVESVTLKLGAPPNEERVIMRREPVQGDRVGGARFVSDLGRYQLEQAGGEVLVVLDGKSHAATFRGPR